jgi:Domain of unknown function (DUF4145)
MDDKKITKTKKSQMCCFCGTETRMNILWSHKIDGSYPIGYDSEYGGEVICWHEERFEIHECPSCQKIHLYQEVWDDNWTGIVGMDEDGPVEVCIPGFTQIVYPLKDPQLPKPHELMPDEVKETYEEARQVFPISKRSSAALLRLAIQQLCVMWGGAGNKIDKDIQKLVDNGLPVHIQQALDIVRVIGNSAVHAGEIDVNDDEIARSLFDLVNEIVDEQIAKPKKQALILEQYEKLPETKKRKP